MSKKQYESCVGCTHEPTWGKRYMNSKYYPLVVICGKCKERGFVTRMDAYPSTCGMYEKKGSKQ